MFLPSTESQLELIHTSLADEVQNRYLLTYTPANQTKDGTWRQIDVRVPDPTYRVAARPGYFAPKPTPLRPTIEFTATDPQGEYLSVSADDLQLLEDDVPQRIESFQEASQPVSIVLTLDASGSMRRNEADVIASARAFAGALRPEDKLAVMVFADGVTLLHDLTTDRAASHEAIDRYKTGGGTRFLRRRRGGSGSSGAYRRAPGDRRDDGRTRRKQPGNSARQYAHARRGEEPVEGQRRDDVRDWPRHQG